MVNAFTGDFTYNLPVLTIPGPQGSSYPLSLSYHSGSSAEEEASWVGYGWSLSPGAINRNMRGLPDDDKGKEITYHNKMPRNWTVTAGVGTSPEVFSIEKIPVTAQVSASLSYSNYTGFGYTQSASLNAKLKNANVGLGFSRSETGKSFSLTASPANNMFSVGLTLNDTPNGMTLSGNINPFTSLHTLADEKKKGKVREALKQWTANSSVGFGGGNHGIFSFAEMQRPTVITGYDGNSTAVDVALEIDPVGPVGIEGRIRGSYSYQESVPETLINSYGYLYASEPASNNSVQDYYTEKDTPFNKRDVFLGIGMNNADNFSVTGEGLNGGFRLYHKQIGQFYPNIVKSSTGRTIVGLDLHIGPTVGVGITDIGSGATEMYQGPWKKNLTTFSSPSEDEGVFFRFNNDMGGTLSYANVNDQTLKYADEPIAARVISFGNWGNKSGSVYLPKSPALPAPLRERNSRSSYIGYTLNETMVNQPAKSYSKRKDISDMTLRTDSDTKNQIGEFSVYNSSGMQYVYALPVYTRKEKQLQVGTKNARIDHNYLAYGIEEDKQSVKVGSERVHIKDRAYSSAYANTFLLTQINTPDYVDVEQNGPDLTDKGGYTLFHYTKLYGKQPNTADNDEGNWYRWRLPYTGHIYQRGSFSDPMDDRASVSQGEKEIYLLNKIETKTHIAIFTTEGRDDAMDAAENANQPGLTGANKLKRLKRIDLYNKAEYDQALSNGNLSTLRPIKSVFFDYDYSLCPGIPNGTNGQGKLTLKKVWFEYYGVKQAVGKISPYVFEYKYPDYSQYPTKYTSLGVGYKDYQVDAQGNDPQNPKFSYFQNDAWSNYQESTDGESRFQRMITWVNQLPNAPKFDPAAWQLKVIKLPSGGEIHVQYEQDDYAYVQDQPAHVMRQLETYTDNLVTLAPESGETAGELSKAIRSYYINGGGRKMYFKFLYRLLDNLIGKKPEPSVSDDCNADYMTGYVNVRDVGVTPDDKVWVSIGGEDKYVLPRQVCLDFVKTQRVGKLSGTCQGGGLTGTNAESLVRGLINMVRINVSDAKICSAVSPSNSYLRIPAIKAKKGGGLRVKRLLTFDKGMNGESVLYGSEYLYETTDATGKRITSGVATMEPSSIREENVLVSFIKRGEQSGFSKIIAGIDKKQSEGPLGESVMPNASVGYSKVVVKNIHSGKTSTGFSINEYYTPNQLIEASPSPIRLDRNADGSVVAHPANAPRTARNPNGTYAFFGKQTEIQQADPDYQMLPLVLVNKFINRSWLSQGFSFYINDMTGKSKRMATYAGTYTKPGDENKATLITEQVSEYYQPGEQIPVVDPKTGKITYQPLGQEIDVTYAQRGITEKADDVAVTMDFTTCLICFGVSFPVVLPTVTTIRNETYIHTTTKVIRQTCPLRKTRSYADGIYHTNEHLAFDPYTGSPVWSKSYDEFSRSQTLTTSTGVHTTQLKGGAYAQQSVMAAWKYPGMAHKYLTEGKVIRSASVNSNLAITYTKDGTEEVLTFANGNVGAACPVLQNFVPGDLLHLGNGAYYHAGEPDFLTGTLPIYRSRVSGSTPTLQELTIVHAGRSNELSIPAGSTTYHSPDGVFTIPNPIDGTKLVGINAFTAALNAKYNALKAAEGKFTLPETEGAVYTQLNISAYANKIPTGYTVALDNATIRNVQFRYNRLAKKITLKLISFEVKVTEKATQNEKWVTIAN